MGISLNQVCIRRLEDPRSTALAEDGILPDSLIPELLKQRLIQRWRAKLEGLILFGSTARREATTRSDIDLLIVFKPKSRLSRKLYSEWDAIVRGIRLDRRDREISPQFAVLPRGLSDAGGLWYEVAIEGIVLWERGMEIVRFLAWIREAMARGRIRRAETHGHPYWIRNRREEDEE